MIKASIVLQPGDQYLFDAILDELPRVGNQMHISDNGTSLVTIVSDLIWKVDALLIDGTPRPGRYTVQVDLIRRN